MTARAVWTALAALAVLCGGVSAAPAPHAQANQERHPPQQDEDEPHQPGSDNDAAVPQEVALDELLAAHPEIEVTAVASAPQVLLGTPLSVLITVEHPPGVAVNVPSSLPLGQAFELGRRASARRTLDDGTRRSEFEIELIAWDVGEQTIAPIPVIYAAGGAVYTAHTEAIAVEVVGLVSDGDDTRRGMAQPVDVYDRDYRALYSLFAAAALLATIGLIWWRVRSSHRRSRPAHTPAHAEARAPAHREALARLAALEDSGALSAADRKPAFIAMSEIVRVYLGRRFGVPAMDATTAELERALASRRDTAELCVLLAPWLERCDLVKYAGAAAAEDDARQALATARRLVTMTAPEPAHAAMETAQGPSAEADHA